MTTRIEAVSMPDYNLLSWWKKQADVYANCIATARR